MVIHLTNYVKLANQLVQNVKVFYFQTVYPVSEVKISLMANVLIVVLTLSMQKTTIVLNVILVVSHVPKQPLLIVLVVQTALFLKMDNVW